MILHDGTVLTMRYQYGEKFVYVLPGGNPDPGETLPEALARELSEELGVSAEVGSMVLAGEVLNFNAKEDTLHCLFEAHLDGQQPDIDPEHTSAQAIEWINLADLPGLNLYPNFAGQLAGYRGAGTFEYTGSLHQPYVG